MNTTTANDNANGSATIADALTAFVAGAQAIINAHYAKHCSNLTPPTLVVEPGRRYAKIVRQGESATDRSVYCFVDMTNGNVLKAETWRKPAKWSRGNVFSAQNGTEGVGPHGANYLAR